MKRIITLASIALLGFAIIPNLAPTPSGYATMSISKEGAAQPSRDRAAPSSNDPPTGDWVANLPECKESGLCVVMVDQAKLSGEQRSQFTELLKVANFPPTSVGPKFSFNGKPEIWGLVLPSAQAKEAYAKVQQFGKASLNKSVNRVGGVKNGG